MTSNALQIRYRIGPFSLAMRFDNEKFYRSILDYMDSIFPVSKRFKIKSDSKINCCCSFLTSKEIRKDFLNRLTAKEELGDNLRYLMMFGAIFRCSTDLRDIKLFPDTPQREFLSIIKSSIPYLSYFVPFFLRNNALLEHCSAVIYKGHGFVFIGDSGAGKSTIVKILVKGGAEIISDEIALINCRDNACFVSPLWVLSPGGRGFNILQRKPTLLKAIFFLNQGKFHLWSLKFNDILKLIYRNNLEFFTQTLGMQEDFYRTVMQISRNSKCCKLHYDRSNKIFTFLDSFRKNR
jgi:hypothetical protein